MCTPRNTSRRLLYEYDLYVENGQSVSTLPKMTWCHVLYLAVLVNFCTSLSTQEVDGLVYTEEELGLDRVEKHIFVWKMDLEESRGKLDFRFTAVAHYSHPVLL